MHQPRPHGTFGAATEEDAAAAELLARRLTNFKNVSGLDSLKMARTLPSGAIAIAQDAGGVLRVIIQQPMVQECEQVESDGTAKNYIPMLFSGAIDNGRVRHGGAIALKLTEQARRRIGGYGKGGFLPAKEVRLKRFVIEHHAMVGELAPKEPNEAWAVTQYDNQRPTWYSGAMAEVMQIVGGYGIQATKDLPDDKIERARMVVPAAFARRIDQELGNTRLPGYTGLPPSDGKFRFDYKFNHTHGVGFDSKGKPWLLRVNSAGVYAMPLPIIPATATGAFREYMEEVGDQEVIWILDRFGGMPSGEGFPILAKDFQSWRRAGVIVKVCDAGDFYQHLMYSSAIGWSFNARGTEAFNTCYDYEEDGVGFGMSYKLSLRLGEAKDGGKLPDSFDLDGVEDMAKLNKYLSMLYRQLGGTSARELAIKYKLRRVPVADLLARSGREGSDEVDYWDNLEATPIASHGGSIARVGQGNLWHRAKPKGQPQIKFPEPFMNGCVSHDFGPSKKNAVPDGYIVRCDTVMFGYYVGDQLKVAKYFLDQRQYHRDVDSDFDECMTVGSWTQTVTEGSISLMGHFYTSDFDEREAAADTTEVTKIVGTDLGYDSKPHFSYDDFFHRPGTLWRHRYFMHKTDTSRSEGYSRTLALCVPFLARNAILHAKTESTSGKRKNTGTSIGSVTDPWSYRYWTDDFFWAWRGAVSGPQAAVPVYPKDGNPVWVVQENYAPGGCSDFADNGPWIPGLPANYTWLIHPNSHEWIHSGGGGSPKFAPKSSGSAEPGKSEGDLSLSILDTPGKVHKDPATTYFLYSPDEFVGVFYRDAVRNVAGTSEYANVSEADPEAPKQRKRYGFTSVADHKTAHHFIGVLNE